MRLAFDVDNLGADQYRVDPTGTGAQFQFAFTHCPLGQERIKQPARLDALYPEIQRLAAVPDNLVGLELDYPAERRIDVQKLKIRTTKQRHKGRVGVKCFMKTFPRGQ